MAVPILQGPLKRKRWIAGSSIHGCWLGSYEYEKQKVFIKRVKPGDVVFDIGANVGFYTLLASVLVGNEGKVIAFEPLPRNLVYLNRHMKMNHCPNVTIYQYAVSDNTGEACFNASSNPSMGHLSEGGEIKVKTVALDELILLRDISPPEVLKIDVEGAEDRVLKGAEHTINRHKPIIFLSTHSPKVHHSCCERLKTLKYNLLALDHNTLEYSDEILAIPSLPGK
jgi:FkbM family methyltransferase